jgi:hypothetical protein
MTNSNTNTQEQLREAKRELEQATEAERRRIYHENIQQAVAEELSEREGQIQREAENIRQEITRDSRAEEAQRARLSAPGNLLLLILIFLILYLIAAATGRPDIISFPRSRDSDPAPLPSVLGQANAAGRSGAESRSIGAAADTGSGTSGNASSGTNGGTGSAALPQGANQDQAGLQVASPFVEFYNQRGGERIFGKPISDVTQENGRTVQYFERARMELWPELNNPQYTVQLGLLGVEFTQGMFFPNQRFFVSQPDQAYTRITEHGVSQRFLQFWQQNGGLDIFGHPISEEIQEMLPSDMKLHTVQYFERARLEYHPDSPGNEIQIGLLGREIYLNNPAPNVVAAPKPTPVLVP